jgi:hypothetical protein
MNGTVFALPRPGTDVVRDRATSSPFAEGTPLPSRASSVLQARRRGGDTLVLRIVPGRQLLMWLKASSGHAQKGHITLAAQASCTSEGRDAR